jgi:hypothetical protein
MFMLTSEASMKFQLLMNVTEAVQAEMLEQLQLEIVVLGEMQWGQLLLMCLA